MYIPIQHTNITESSQENNEAIPEDQLNDRLEPEALLTLCPEQDFYHHRARSWKLLLESYHGWHAFRPAILYGQSRIWHPSNTDDPAEVQDPGLIPLLALPKNSSHDWTHTICVPRSLGAGEIHMETWLCLAKPGQITREGTSKWPDICWSGQHACPRASPCHQT